MSDETKTGDTLPSIPSVPPTTVETRLAALESEVEGMRAQLKSGQDRQDRLEKRVEETSRNHNALADDVAAMKGDISSLKADMSGVKSDMVSVKTETAEQTKTLARIETDSKASFTRIEGHAEKAANSVAGFFNDPKLRLIFSVIAAAASAYAAARGWK